MDIDESCFDLWYQGLFKNSSSESPSQRICELWRHMSEKRPHKKRYPLRHSRIHNSCFRLALQTCSQRKQGRSFELDVEADQEEYGKVLQESILIGFDFIWKVLLSNRNFATLLGVRLCDDYSKLFVAHHRDIWEVKPSYLDDDTEKSLPSQSLHYRMSSREV